MAKTEQMEMEVVEQKPEVADAQEQATEPKPEPKAEVAEVNNMDEVSMSVPQNEGSVFTSLAAFKDAYTIGRYFAQSSLIPQSYQGKPMDCAIAVDIANRMGVSPTFVMQNLWVVRGVPSWSGSACMGIIRACGRFKDVKPVYTGERDKDTWGCYISAKDAKTGEEYRGTEVTIKMAKAEGWYNKSGSKWQTMPEQMLAYRASAFFARIYAPNELMGYRVEGEAEDMAKPEKSKAVDVMAGESEVKA